MRWSPHVHLNRRARRAGLITAQIVAALMSLTVVVGSGYAWATYRTFKSSNHKIDVIGAARRITVTGTATSSRVPSINGKDQNILIVGNDDRDTATDAELAALGIGRDGGSQNTDTMMVLHVPGDGSRATIISFPRDSYVAIPGFGQNKLNSAYVDGMNAANGDKTAGSALLVRTIEDLTGLTIDHYMQVDLIGFARIDEAIGGVSLCLNQAMGPATYVGQTGIGYDSGYEPDGSFITDYTGINLHKGVNTDVTGRQALAFVRQRHGLPNGDLDRIKRQQYFLSAVFRKLVSGGVLFDLPKLQHLLTAFNKSVTMDQSLDPLKLAEQMQGLTAGNVRFATIPTSGFDTVSGVGSVVVVNTAAMPKFITSLVNPPAKSSTPTTSRSGSSTSAPATGSTNSSQPTVTTAATAGCID